MCRMLFSSQNISGPYTEHGPDLFDNMSIDDYMLASLLTKWKMHKLQAKHTSLISFCLHNFQSSFQWCILLPYEDTLIKFSYVRKHCREIFNIAPFAKTMAIFPGRKIDMMP